MCEDGFDLTIEEQHSCSSVSLGDKTQPLLMEESVTQKLHHLEICANEFPGSSATYRMLEVTSLIVLAVGLVRLSYAQRVAIERLSPKVTSDDDAD